MKDRSLCQVKKATRYKRRIKPVLEDNDYQMKSCIIPKIYQSMITERNLVGGDGRIGDLFFKDDITIIGNG
jgi:hypothetical protein